MQESWETCFQLLGQEDPLKKEMATDSSILVWEIPWTERPGRLQSKKFQWVGADLVTKHTHTHNIYIIERIRG